MQVQELYLNAETRTTFFKWLVRHADKERAQLTVEFRKKDGTLRSLSSTPVLRHAYKAKTAMAKHVANPDLITLVDDDIFDAYRIGGMDFDDAISKAFRSVNANRVTRLTYNNEFAWSFI
jgi:hypothetical protein